MNTLILKYYGKPLWEVLGEGEDSEFNTVYINQDQLDKAKARFIERRNELDTYNPLLLHTIIMQGNSQDE